MPGGAALVRQLDAARPVQGGLSSGEGKGGLHQAEVWAVWLIMS